MTVGWVGYGGYAKCSACEVTHREAELRDGKCIDTDRCYRGQLSMVLGQGVHGALSLGGPVWPGKPPDPTDPGPDDPPPVAALAPPGDEVLDDQGGRGSAENVEGRAVSGDLVGIPEEEKSR